MSRQIAWGLAAIGIVLLAGCGSPQNARTTVRLRGYLEPAHLVRVDDREGWSGTLRVLEARPWRWSRYDVEIPPECEVWTSSGSRTITGGGDEYDWYTTLLDGETAVEVSGVLENGGDTLRCSRFDTNGSDVWPVPPLDSLPLTRPPLRRDLATLDGHVVDVTPIPGQPDRWLMTISLPGLVQGEVSLPEQYQALIVDESTTIDDLRAPSRKRGETLRLLQARRVDAVRAGVQYSAIAAYANTLQVIVD